MPSLALTPRGHLLLVNSDTSPALSDTLGRTLERAFARGSGHGLLELGARDPSASLPADLTYWRDFGAKFVIAICTHPGADSRTAIAPPTSAELDAIAAAAPPMDGAEYVTRSLLETLWAQIADALRAELEQSGLSVQTYLERKNSAWHLVGRVHFNLAENRRDEEAPFAFLATYTDQLSVPPADLKVRTPSVQHLPLGRALTE